MEPLHRSSDPKVINRRGIIKDCLGATQFWTDYQLRPNFCIALATAPDLIDPKRAWHALGMAETILMGPLGIKTLDPRFMFLDIFLNHFYSRVTKFLEIFKGLRNF